VRLSLHAVPCSVMPVAGQVASCLFCSRPQVRPAHESEAAHVQLFFHANRPSRDVAQLWPPSFMYPRPVTHRAAEARTYGPRSAYEFCVYGGEVAPARHASPDVDTVAILRAFTAERWIRVL